MSPEEFEAQLSYLAARYRFLSPDETLDLAESGGLPDDACVLTFDDGYVGQYEYALPILLRRGLRAFFFIPTGLLEEGRCPTVEKQRVLQYALWPYHEFYGRFVGALDRYCPEVDRRRYVASDENIDAALSYYGEYRFYSPLERLFRKVRERVLSGAQFDRAIDAMFAREFDERAFVQRYFMGWRHVEELARLGMELGGHGHEHLIDTAVAPEIAGADAVRSLDILRSRVGRAVRSYCYPYGIFRPETVEALRRNGIRIAFTCRHGRGDAGSPLLFDRVDCRNVS